MIDQRFRQLRPEGPETAMLEGGGRTRTVRELALAALRENRCSCGRAAAVVHFRKQNYSAPEVFCELHEPDRAEAQRSRDYASLDLIERAFQADRKAERARAYAALTALARRP